MGYKVEESLGKSGLKSENKGQGDLIKDERFKLQNSAESTYSDFAQRQMVGTRCLY